MATQGRLPQCLPTPRVLASQHNPPRIPLHNSNPSNTDEGTGKFLKLTAVVEGGVESYLIKFKGEKGREEFSRECADRLS